MIRQDDIVTSPGPTAPSVAPWLRTLCRLTGLAAVVLGGWCLWLAFPTAQKPVEVEAYDEWTAKGEPELLTAASAQSSPANELKTASLPAVITQISAARDGLSDEASQVIPAVQFDDGGPHHVAFAVGGFSTERPARFPGPATNKKSPAPTAGAWLTGTIEADASALLEEQQARKRRAKSHKDR